MPQNRGQARAGADTDARRSLASGLAVLALLAGFAVANSALRCAAQRRLGQARAVARVAQSALLREVPRSVAAARLASRYLSASAEAQVGGDLVEVIAGGASPRWLITGAGTNIVRSKILTYFAGLRTTTTGQGPLRTQHSATEPRSMPGVGRPSPGADDQQGGVGGLGQQG